MKNFQRKNGYIFIVVCLILLYFSSCVTTKKIDKYVAEQYNNQLPNPAKKSSQNISITSVFKTGNNPISTTIQKTDKFLPLIVYWKYDHRQSCSLNPYIAVANFTNAINVNANKSFIEKLNGRKLELTVEQVPTTFAIVYKENMIWLIYGFSWAKIFIEPELTDLVISYKLTQADNVLKTGKITVKNTDNNRGIRFFQKWKSAISEYLDQYNANYKNMTISFLNQLNKEL